MSPGGPAFDEDPFQLPPLVEESRKALRLQLEEELRAMPLAQRIERVIELVETDKSSAAFVIRSRGAKSAQGWTANCGEHDQHGPTIDDAVVNLGADILEKIEKQAAGLREAVAQIESKIHRARGKR
jgi:hypothetical protein